MLHRQIEYWNQASEKTFTHQVPMDLWRRYVKPDARILDLGCGYGRTCAALVADGFPNAVGIDIAPKMIERGRREYPALDLRIQESDRLPWEDGSFDAVLLIAVLTCVPTDDGQRSIVQEAARVLRPDGILFLSDFPLQSDERNQRRYQEFLPIYGTRGVFALPEGAVLRHHSDAWFAELFADWTLLESEMAAQSTMNGHDAKITRRFYRRSA